MLTSFTLKIKRKETPFYAFLYKLGKSIQFFSFPSIKYVHLPLYYLHRLFRMSIIHPIHVLWSVPLFAARCQKVGKNLCLPNGIPYIEGNHLKIVIGDNVTIMRTTIGASKTYDEPVLTIGNNSTVGFGTIISVAQEIIIGDNCLIGPYCLIMDSDDHPINPQKRLFKQSVDKKDILPVKIGNNVWIGSHCVILKGVTVGDNSIIATHSVVTKDVMENCIYAGYPARPTLRDIDKIQ